MPGLYTATCEVAEPGSKAVGRARRLGRLMSSARTDDNFLRAFAYHYGEQLGNPPRNMFFATDIVRTDDELRAFAAGVWLPAPGVVNTLNKRLAARDEIIADETFYPALLKVLDQEQPDEVGKAEVLLGTYAAKEGEVIGLHPEVERFNETSGLRIDSVDVLPEMTFEHFTAYIIVNALRTYRQPLPGA